MANRYPVIVTNTGAGDTAPFAFKEIPSGDDLNLIGNFIRIGSTSAAQDVIKDANGNSVIRFPTAVSSAVNYFVLTNSANASAINVIEAAGTSTSVSIHIKPKGPDGEIIVGSGGVAATIESSGAYNLVLKTGSTNSGTLTFNQGDNGNIDFAPHGTGKVRIGTNNIVHVGDSGTVSNTMLATGIAVGKLSLTSANIIVGNASNVAAAVSLSGDATISNAGALTIANDAVTFAKMQNISTAKVLGRSAAGTGDVQELSVNGTGDVVLNTNPTMSGITMADNTHIALNATTGTKIGTATTQKLGFFNATPIARPTLASYTASANSNSVATGINNIRTVLINLGLVG